MVILYSTGCPKCAVLKKKLEQAHIEFTVDRDEETMISLGIDSLPVLGVDGKLFGFNEAMKWIVDRERR